MIKVFTDYVEKTIEIDGNNVVFHLAQAYGPFLNILARCSNWSSIIDKKWVPEEIILLEKFDDYWQGPAKIENVQIKYVNEYTTRKLMLQTGDVDIAYIPVQYLSEVKKIADVEVVKNLPTLAN